MFAFLLTNASPEAVAHILEGLPTPAAEIGAAATEASLEIVTSGHVDARVIARGVTVGASATAAGFIIGGTFGNLPGALVGAGTGAAIGYITNPGNALPRNSAP